MTLRSLRFALAALAALGLFLVPTTAGADVVGAAGAFTLSGSNGYRITVLASSRRADGRGEVLLFVGRKGSGTSYFVPANVTDAHVEADLGRLGEISVQFVPSGVVKAERSICGGDEIQFEAGVYQGAIKFRGEEGYTSASATSVAAEVSPFLDLVCAGAGEGESIGRGIPGARLRISSRAGGLSLQVNQNRPGARVLYSAQMSERRGRIAITRSVEGRTRSGAFRFDPNLDTATLAPPAPFSGSAAFHRNAAVSNQWTGSLALDFPGRSNVRLTGPGLKATLVPARHTIESRG